MVEGSIAELVAGFDEVCPRLATAEAVHADASLRLEGAYCHFGGSTEDAALGRRDLVREALEPLLQVPDASAMVTDTEQQGRRWMACGHNGRSADQAMNSARSFMS